MASEYVYVTSMSEVTPQATPTPQPTAQPTEQPGVKATVTAGGGLKLREGPGTGYATILTMPLGATVTLLGEAEYGFYPVRYGDASGYASAQYLVSGGDATPIPVPTVTPVPPPSQPVAARTGTVSAPSGQNLRAEPSASAQVMATLGYGVNVTVTGERTNGFYPVRVGTLSGYVSADYVTFETFAATPTPVPTATPAPQQGGGESYRVVVESDNGLNLRAAPHTGSDVVYVLPYGMMLTVLGEAENGFLYVQWAGYTGYVSAEYVAPLGAQ